MLEQTNSIDVMSLTKLLYAGEATVRRDLCKLESEGLLLRSHGKAISMALYADKSVPYDQRKMTGFIAKRMISEAAVKAHVRAGSVVMLDASKEKRICKRKHPIDHR